MNKLITSIVIFFNILGGFMIIATIFGVASLIYYLLTSPTVQQFLGY